MRNRSCMMFHRKRWNEVIVERENIVVVVTVYGSDFCKVLKWIDDISVRKISVEYVIFFI